MSTRSELAWPIVPTGQASRASSTAGPTSTTATLLPDLDRLADSYRLIYYDQRGRGQSASGVRPEDVTLSSDVEDRTNLDVSTLMVLSATVERGAKLSNTQITLNIGPATASASTTRYYLSRDTSKSSDDILLSAKTLVPALVRGGSVTGPAASAIMPSTASGVYRILACADDRAVVAEISDTNNCYMAVQSVTAK